MKLLFLWAMSSLLLAACTPKPEPLHYGTDECDYCRMTIVDPQHGAEVITQKGKIFKFDAIECMVHHVQKTGPDQFGSFWVNDYTATTGALVDATTCTFLISKNIPSPMGAYLSGFEEKTAAEKFFQEKGGEVFDWSEILKKLGE
ncbi:MAG: nitrous oxide reductase accessory protein NosL [Saprospirales bacterium]|nr:nitrous oxide reductase accessory protein NosL [Saprospirales bacterium]